MKQQFDHRKHSTLVVGLGESGYSTVRYLARNGVRMEVADSRDKPPMIERLRREFPGIDVHLGAFSSEMFASFGRIIVSPGVALSNSAIRFAHQAGIEVIGDVELFSRIRTAPVIAITGSNGKSTVTRLVGDLLAAVGEDVRVGGNIGVPVLDLLDDASPQRYVLELSSFQLESTSSLNPGCAVVLNISPDHMDRYSSVADYAAAKARIYRNCGTCIVNRDDAVAAALTTDQCGRTVSYGMDTPAYPRDFGCRLVDGRQWLVQGDTRLLAADELKLQGQHNVSNVLAAFALVVATGRSIEPAMLVCARHFPGLPHRMELVAERNGVRWINDSKGTNVGATCAALEGLDSPIVLIAGGQGKGADFSVLSAVAQTRVKHAILFGEDRDAIAAAMADMISVTLVDTLGAATAAAESVCVSGDVVLFSPACASFDMFRSYEHRGDVFRRLVQGASSCRR